MILNRVTRRLLDVKAITILQLTHPQQCLFTSEIITRLLPITQITLSPKPGNYLEICERVVHVNTHQALLSPDYQQTDTPNARVAVKVNSYTTLQLIKSVIITEQIYSSQVYFRDLGSYRFRTATDTHHNRENIYIKVRSCVNPEASVLLKSLKETPTCDYTRLLNE